MHPAVRTLLSVIARRASSLPNTAAVRDAPRTVGRISARTHRLHPSSWHNGSKVLPAGGGKWIAQKFKELPGGARRARPLRLPTECAPPPLPLEEMLRLAREQQALPLS